MLSQIKTTIARKDSRLLSDALGAAALVVMLLASLHLPSMI